MELLPSDVKRSDEASSEGVPQTNAEGDEPASKSMTVRAAGCGDMA